MKKRVLGLLLAGVMACSVTACGSGADVGEDPTAETAIENEDGSDEREENSDTGNVSEELTGTDETVADETADTESENNTGDADDQAESIKYYDGSDIEGSGDKFEETGHYIVSGAWYTNDDVWADVMVFWSAVYEKASTDENSRGFTCEFPIEENLRGSDTTYAQIADFSNFFGFTTSNYKYMVWYFPDGVDDEGRTPAEFADQKNMWDLATDYIVSEDNKFSVWYSDDNLEDAQRILDSCTEYIAGDIADEYNDRQHRVIEE